MKVALVFLIASVVPANAQTWYTPDPTRRAEQRVEGAYLVNQTPIKILRPPKLISMKVAWDKVSANWTITLQSEAVLDPVYKPCFFTFGGWAGYTVRAGDKDGASTLMLVPKTYEQAITLRDALMGLHKLSPQQVITEDKEAEKQRG